LVVVADVLLAFFRGVSAQRLAAAFVFASVLLWGFAGLLGWIGTLLTYDAAKGGFIGNWSAMSGLVVGAPIGAVSGALVGIALSERGLSRAWPEARSLALAAVTLLLLAALTIFLLSRMQSAEQQAGRSVFVVFPLLGASALLGWLLGLRKA
jgi:hypothetical protein